MYAIVRKGSWRVQPVNLKVGLAVGFYSDCYRCSSHPNYDVQIMGLDIDGLRHVRAS